MVTAEDIAAALKREKKVAALRCGTKAAKAAKEAYKAADREAKRREAALKAEKKAHDARPKAEAEAAAAEAAEATEEDNQRRAKRGVTLLKRARGSGPFPLERPGALQL